MAAKPRHQHANDAKLAAALARGASVEDAARSAGISSRTAFRRLQDDSFRAMIGEARSQMVRRVAGRLADAGDKAVATLVGLLDADDRLKLGAAGKILEHLFKSGELVELQAAVDELSRKVEGVTHERDRERASAAGGSAVGGNGLR